jgi:hypothetical protein
VRLLPATLLIVLAVAAPAAAQVQVGAPVDGSKLPAVAFGKRLVSATVTLSGTATPQTNVPISATCRGYDCTAITFAGRDGRWTTRMVLVARKGHQRVTVDVAGVAVRLTLSRRMPPALAAAPLAQPTGLGGGDAVVLVGDSLAIGMAPALQGLLPGRPVLVDARVGRPLDEGMQVLAAAADPPHGQFAFSLFTNDDPLGIERLDQAVRGSVAALGAHGCAVWATIVRPNVGGHSYTQVNDRLRALALDPALAGRLLIADWAHTVKGHRKAYLAKDRVHATWAGYLARARLYADALSACGA